VNCVDGDGVGIGERKSGLPVNRLEAISYLSLINMFLLKMLLLIEGCG